MTTILTPLTPNEAAAAAILVHRLVERHDLSPTEAFTAVVQAHHREAGLHTDLVALEADAFVTETLGPVVRAMREALRPAVEAAAQFMAELARALRPVAQQAAGRVDRPAWATPYGPPPRRRH